MIVFQVEGVKYKIVISWLQNRIYEIKSLIYYAHKIQRSDNFVGKPVTVGL